MRLRWHKANAYVWMWLAAFFHVLHRIAASQATWHAETVVAVLDVRIRRAAEKMETERRLLERSEEEGRE